jgi:hypothetical protein
MRNLFAVVCGTIAISAVGCVAKTQSQLSPVAEQRFWVGHGVIWFCPTPDIRPGQCPSLEYGSSFTATALAKGGPYNEVYQVRLSNGAIGYIDETSKYAWKDKDPVAEFNKFLAEQKARREEIDRLTQHIYDLRIQQIHQEHDTEMRRIDCEYNRHTKIHIGMTSTEVVTASCLPKHVNSTETSSGTREQWVYGDGDYLYFEGGHLVAMQLKRRAP